MNLMKVAAILAVLVIASGCLCGGPADTATTTTEQQTGGQQDTGNQNVPVTTARATATTLKATATTLKATATTAASGGILSDLSAAISSGVAYKCTYDYQGVVSEMTVKGKKFSSSTAVENQLSHAVSDGVWMYTWMDGQDQGVKFNIEQMKNNAQAAQGAQKAPSMDEISSGATHVQCSPAVVSDSQFTPPSNIQFQDMGELLKAMQGGQIDVNALKNIQPPRRPGGISG